MALIPPTQDKQTAPFQQPQVISRELKAEAASVFHAFDLDNSNTVNALDFCDFMTRQGLCVCRDARLRNMKNGLREFHHIGFQARKTNCNIMDAFVLPGAPENAQQITVDQFTTLIADCASLVAKACGNRLVVPTFARLCEAMTDAYNEVKANDGGENAGYIPQLDETHVDWNQFGMSITTLDGQHFSIGDCTSQFAIQSCSKPISYCLALKEFGYEYVSESVSVEASGRPFNEVVLKDHSPGKQIPHNPLINAGAIMSVSMVYPQAEGAERRERVVKTWQDLSEGYTMGESQKNEHPEPKEKIGMFNTCDMHVNMDMFRSEAKHAYQNFCLANYMAARNAYPACFGETGERLMAKLEKDDAAMKAAGIDRGVEVNEKTGMAIKETLNTYFQICSIMSQNQFMSVMAATLAGGGNNPFTGNQVLKTQHIKNILPIMTTAGMYDYSGHWSFDVGVPAKSGVGGCVFMVIPKIGGISIFSPRLDENGNSVRGVAGAIALSKRMVLLEMVKDIGSNQLYPLLPLEAKEMAVNEANASASLGDTFVIQDMAKSGATTLGCGDYDGVNPLHIASEHGNAALVKFLLGCLTAEEKQACDRWGKNAATCAMCSDAPAKTEILTMLGEHNVHPDVMKAEAEKAAAGAARAAMTPAEVHNSMSVLWASSNAGLIGRNRVLKLVGQRGAKNVLTCADYDGRTALMVATSSQATMTVSYLLAQASKHGLTQAVLNAKDRFGNTALDDLAREKSLPRLVQYGNGAANDAEYAAKWNEMEATFAAAAK